MSLSPCTLVVRCKSEPRLLKGRSQTAEQAVCITALRQATATEHEHVQDNHTTALCEARVFQSVSTQKHGAEGFRV